MNMLKRFWEEEDGMAVVDMLLIIAVIIIVALMFKDAIINWLTETMPKVFDPEIPEYQSPTPKPT